MVRHTSSLIIIRRWAWMAALCAAVLAAFSVLGGRAAGPPAADALALRVLPVPLDPESPERLAVGPLRYNGGLWLSSEDPRFGGLSDLRVGADGASLWAVSDCGRGLTGRLVHDVLGRLVGLEDVALHDLTGPEGDPLRHGQVDAESLTVENDGRLAVGFEGRGRIWSYGPLPPFVGPARPLATPEGLRRCGPNAGLETMARLGDDRRFVLCEGRRAPAEDSPAWIGEAGAWSERSYPLLFDGGWGGEAFRPTAAAVLPGGDLLVLERRFPPIGTRIVRLNAAELEGVGPLHPQELVRLEKPLTLDNFEGLDARLDAAGRTVLYLLSDDNNCAKRAGGPRGTGLQRTLLLSFLLED